VVPRPVDACGARQVLDRGGQAIARGSCLSKVLDRVRATGAAHYQRWCSANLRDRSTAAVERGVGRVRWRGRRKAGGGCSARQAFVFGGPAGSLGGSPRKGRRPRAMARKEKGGRQAQRITSVGVRRACGIARLHPSKGAPAACGGEEGGRRVQRKASVCVRRTCVGAKLGWRQRHARFGARSVVTR
jgi:hypothetical protein